jgi:hypothetical protein
MNTAREYRQYAMARLQLAHESTDFYVKVALTELAGEFRRKADTIGPAPTINAIADFVTTSRPVANPDQLGDGTLIRDLDPARAVSM